MLCTYHASITIGGRDPEQVLLKVYEGADLIATYSNANYWLYTSANWMLRIGEFGGHSYGGADGLPCQLCVGVLPELTYIPCLEQMFYDDSEGRVSAIDEDYDPDNDTLLWESSDLPRAYSIGGFRIPAPDSYVPPVGASGSGCRRDLLEYLIGWMNENWFSRLMMVSAAGNDNYLASQAVEDVDPSIYPDQIFPNPDEPTESCGLAFGMFSDALYSISADLCLGGTPINLRNLQITVGFADNGAVGESIELIYSVWQPGDPTKSPNNLQLSFQLIYGQVPNWWLGGLSAFPQELYAVAAY